MSTQDPITVYAETALYLRFDNLTIDETGTLTEKCIDAAREVQDQREDHTPLAVVHNLTDTDPGEPQ